MLLCRNIRDGKTGRATNGASAVRPHTAVPERLGPVVVPAGQRQPDTVTHRDPSSHVAKTGHVADGCCGRPGPYASRPARGALGGGAASATVTPPGPARSGAVR